jgi:catechol 2,3-dioxygenase-like lactoylglutathione lyase family enzyme
MSAQWSIRATQHVGLHVADLERSLRFYRDLLGFEVVFQWNPTASYISTLVGYAQPDLHAVILRPPGSNVLLELVDFRGMRAEPVDAASAVPGTAHVGFTVSNLDQLYEYLTAHGVRSVSSPVTPTIGPNKGGRVVNVLDPDGIRLELIESPRQFDAYDPSTEEGNVAR